MQVHIEKESSIQHCVKIGHLVILNAVQDIEDIQGKEQWKVIVYAIPEDWHNKSINESAGSLFRAITQ